MTRGSPTPRASQKAEPAPRLPALLHRIAVLGGEPDSVAELRKRSVLAITPRSSDIAPFFVASSAHLHLINIENLHQLLGIGQLLRNRRRRRAAPCADDSDACACGRRLGENGHAGAISIATEVAGLMVSNSKRPDGGGVRVDLGGHPRTPAVRAAGVAPENFESTACGRHRRRAAHRENHRPKHWATIEESGNYTPVIQEST